MTITEEQNNIQACSPNAEGLLEFTREMKELLTKYGYTEVVPGEWWVLGDAEGGTDDAS